MKLLIREGEGLTTEFKEKYTPRIDEDIVAFSNTKGGTLLLGVRDDGAVVGDRLTNELKARINSLAHNCKPAVVVDVAQLGEVVAIDVVEGTEKPYACGSGHFRRLNGTTQKMSQGELRSMFAENDPVPFEGRSAKGFTFEAIARSKVRTFTREAGISIGHAPIPDFLRSLKAADETRVLNSGILFFAKDVGRFLSQSLMTCVAFKGVDRVDIIDRKDIRDDLLTQFNEAMIFIERHLNVRSEIRGVNRHDIYEIPLEALREAVVNALMHRDYSVRGTQVGVEVYDDRVEIVNPGGLPQGVTGRNFGRISIRRNEVISDLFFRLHKCELAGSGIKRMRRALASAGLAGPRFDPDEYFFRVIFDRPPEAARGATQETTQKTTQKTTQSILDIIARNPGSTRKELAEATRISDNGIKYHLRRMQQNGVLRRIGSDRTGHWEVVKKKSG